MTYSCPFRLMHMRLIGLATALLVSGSLAWTQGRQLKTVEAILERYQQALGGVHAIKEVQSETVRGDVVATGMQGKATFVYYAKPFKVLRSVTLPNGGEITSGFDGSVSWSVTPQGASIDKTTAL